MTEIRPPLRETDLRYLAAGMGASILPILNLLPLWVILFSLLFAAWRLIPASLGHDRTPLAFLRLPVGLACFLGIWLEFGSFNGVEPGTALLCLMLGLKLMESWTYRDGLILAVLAYVLLLAVALNHQELPSAIWLSAVCVFQTAIFLRITRIRPPGPLAPNLRLAARLLAQALPIALIMFVLFPRVSGPLWGTPTPETQAVTGLSDRMAPGAISQLAQSNELAFRVSFPDGEIPEPSQRYWRGPVFHAFDGQEWREGRLPEHQPDFLPLGDGLAQEITLEEHGHRWIIALDMPGGEAPSDTEQGHDMSLRSGERVSERRQYTVRSWPSYNLDPELPESWQQALTDFPEDSNPETRALGETWAEEADGDPRRLIDKAMEHFSQEAFFYTLEPPELGRHAMDEFLFDSRRGFCEHYAAAFTLLMRAADVPARVVTGYLGAEFNPVAGHYRVRQSNAHAWSEVWIRGEGWVRVDPTGAIDPERRETELGSTAEIETVDWEGGFSFSNLALQLELFWDTVQARWEGWFLAYGEDQQRDFLERLGLPGGDALRLALIMTALIGLSLFALWLGLWLRQRPAWPKDPVERSWLQFQQRMARAGWPRQASEGPGDWLRRLEREAPALAARVRPLINRFRSARYAGIEADGDRLRTQVRALSRARLRQLGKAKPPENG